jgi:hypothetical protein
VAHRYESGFGRWAGSMQGAGRTVWGCRETLPCLLTFSSGSTRDESGRSQRHTGEQAGSFELRRCMMVVAASRRRWFVTQLRMSSQNDTQTQCPSPGLSGSSYTSPNSFLHHEQHICDSQRYTHQASGASPTPSLPTRVTASSLLYIQTMGS